jgi:mono/diheme cytochrome c family protein
VAVDGVRLWDRTEADSRLLNPRAATPEVLAEGAAVYAINCAICHGSTGRRDGVLAEHYPTIPDLSAPAVQAYSDGWLYSVVREGGFNMPSQAEALSPSETWAVVHYLRTFGQP